MSFTTLLIGTVDCNDRVNTRLMAMSLGKPARAAAEYGGPGVDIARVGTVDTSALVESRFVVEVSASSVDGVSAIVGSISDAVRELSDIIVRPRGSSLAGMLKVRIGECIEIPMDDPSALIDRHAVRVEVVVRRDPWVRGSTCAFYAADPVSLPAVLRLGWPAATNLQVNPSFELDTNADGLADYYSLADRSTSAAPTATGPAGRVGGYGQRLQYAGSGDTGAYAKIIGPILGSGYVGQPLTLSVYSKLAASGCAVRLEIMFQTAGWVAISNPYVAIPASTTWIRTVVPVAAVPENTGHITYGVTISGIDTGDTFDLILDDMQLEVSASASAYFDGSYPSCSWSGTAHASTSARTAKDLDSPGPAPLDLGVAAPSADLRCFWAGLYPDPKAAIGSFVHEMHDKTWTGGAATTEAAGWPDGSGNTVWSDTSDALVTTSIDTASLEPGEYLVLARCKTAVVHGDVFCGSSAVEAEMLSAHVESTTLEWYPLGVVSLPTQRVRGAAAAPLYIGLKSIVSGTMYINCVALIPTSWGMVGWRDAASHCHALVYEDDMVYADDVAGLDKAIGGRQLRATKGAIVAVAGRSSSVAPTLATILDVSCEQLWEQLPSS